MDFRVSGLSSEPFTHLYGLSEAALALQGMRRYIADSNSGYPDRIEMRHAKMGESVLLLNHMCQAALSPYRTTHAIFILEGAGKTYEAINEIPEVMRCRILSLRGFDRNGMMHDADIVDGAEMEPLIYRLFDNSMIDYIHVHNAKRGCYSGRIDRA